MIINLVGLFVIKISKTWLLASCMSFNSLKGLDLCYSSLFLGNLWKVFDGFFPLPIVI